MLFLKKINRKSHFVPSNVIVNIGTIQKLEIYIVLMIDTDSIHMTSHCLEISDDATEQFSGLHIYGMSIKWNLF